MLRSTTSSNKIQNPIAFRRVTQHLEFPNELRAYSQCSCITSSDVYRILTRPTPPLPPGFNIFLIKSPFSAKIGLKSRPTPLFRPRTAYCIQHWLELKLSGFAYLMSTPKPQSFSSQLSWRTRISFFRFLPQASWGGKKHPYYKKEFFTNSNSWKIFYNMICFFTDVLSSSKSTWLSAHDLSSAILNTSNVRLAVYVWKLSS